MAEGKKTTKKPAVKTTANKPAEEEAKKINPWIPVAVVVAIVALIGIMAALGGNNTTTTSNVNQAASGTTQSGTTGTTPATNVDVSWITLETTPNQVVSEAGIPAKMLQQLISVTDADMDKPFSELGGDATVSKVASVVSQFGGGAMGGTTGGTTGAPSGMGGTTTP